MLRKENVIFDGVIESMRHLTQSVTEIKNNLEGGVVLDGYHEFEVNDILECYDLN